MSVLVDIAKYGLLALLLLLFIYLVLRVGTIAVLQSIADFRRQQRKGKAVTKEV